MSRFDVAIIGAGAAGMLCAAHLGRAGLRVVLMDHAHKLAEKIRISGGGRCNFTNLDVSAQNFISRNPHFCKAALSAYTPADLLQDLTQHGIAWHEKHRGQLFCDDSSQNIIDWLDRSCQQAGVRRWMGCRVKSVRQEAANWCLETSGGLIQAQRVIVATGGLALPQVGATDFGLHLARQFGLKVVEPRPALVPLTFESQQWAPFQALSGVSLPVDVSTQQTGLASASTKKLNRGSRAMHFSEDMLLTHRGLSGPAILQISSYWEPGEPLSINLVPQTPLEDVLLRGKAQSKQTVQSALEHWLPKRLAQHWAGTWATRRLAEMSDADLKKIAQQLHQWLIYPSGTQGYKKAEVMRGGVDTAGLNQRSLESTRHPGLHFIGEVVDVTGWLGGYNFQWAWASAVSCARSIAMADKGVTL